MSKLKVASCQWHIRPATTFQAFAQHAEGVVEAAATEDVKLLVLPEYLTYELLMGYPRAATLSPRRLRGAFDSHFPPLLPDYLALFRTLAARYGLTILAGSTWHSHAAGGCANSAFLVRPNGEVVTQTKLHLTPPEEAWEGVVGSELIVADVGPARVGVAICYDVEFPEVVRTLATRGANLILVPSWTTSLRGANRVRLCAQARAIENGLYLACASLVGTLGIPAQAPLTGYGQALIMAPIENRLGFESGIVAEATPNLPDGLAVAELDFRRLARARTDSEAPTWRHRRPALYREWQAEGEGLP